MDEEPLARVRQDVADAAEALVNPVTLVALGLLVLNDHVLKAAWPGPVTGKLSDLAGLVFFPILLLSAWELILALMGRWRGPTARSLAIAVPASAAGFILIKMVPSAAEGAGWMLGLAQWLLAIPIRVLAGLTLPPVSRAVVIADPTDLVALPALVLALWVGVSRLRKVGQASWGAAEAGATR